jgi:hypothetical protein
MIPPSLQALFGDTGEVPRTGGGAIGGDGGAHFRETDIRGELITGRPAYPGGQRGRSSPFPGQERDRPADKRGRMALPLPTRNRRDLP